MDNFCNDSVKILINIIKGIITLIQWIIPIILIVMGTFDMVKAVSSGDEKEVQKVTKKFGFRLIYALVIFLIPVIIQLVFTVVGGFISEENYNPDSAFQKFYTCWKNTGTTVNPSEEIEEEKEKEEKEEEEKEEE